MPGTFPSVDSPHRAIQDGLVQDDSYGATLDGVVREDPSIVWRLTTPYGIRVDAQLSQWHAGHVNAVLPLSSGPVLIGTNTGGVWWTNKTERLAYPLSNEWDDPDVRSLEQGPDHADHVIAACSRCLYQTDARVAQPLWRWKQVPGPGGVDDVIVRMVFLPRLRTCVISCQSGVFYAPVPLPGPNAWTWRWTRLPGVPDCGYAGLAPVVATDGKTGFCVATWGGLNRKPANPADRGIYQALWDAATGTFVVTKATFRGTDARGQAFATDGMAFTSLASCLTRPGCVYAGASGDDEYLLAVLRSDDGGATWHTCGATVKGIESVARTDTWGAGEKLNTDSLYGCAGHQGNGYNNCIAVAHTDPDVVALGWCAGGGFLSTDGGALWSMPGSGWKGPGVLDESDGHVHADTHAIIFDPTDPAAQRMYIASDGGVVTTPDRGVTFSSELNRFLPNLEFQSHPARLGGFYGTAYGSPADPTLLGGALQDNGVVVAAHNEPWHPLGGGDGLLFGALATGQLIYADNGEPAPAVGSWDGATASAGGRIPVRSAPAGKSYPDGLNPVLDPKNPQALVFELVSTPVAAGAAGTVMYALSGVGAEIFGLFGGESGVGGWISGLLGVVSGADLYWSHLATLPDGPIWSVSSTDGREILAGTAAGTIYSVDVNTRQATLLTVPAWASAGSGRVTRVLAMAGGDGFAVQDIRAKARLLRRQGSAWTVCWEPGDELIYGLTVDPTGSSPVLYASTDSRVWRSRDLGATWTSVSTGLPQRPHCGDVRFLQRPDGTRQLTLSTFGRSMWQATLGTPKEWRQLGGMIGDVDSGRPAVVGWGPNRLDVFIRSAENTCQHLYWDGGSWKPGIGHWESLGGALSATPTAVSWGPQRIDLVVRDVQGSVFHKAWDGEQWTPSQLDWEPLGAPQAGPRQGVVLGAPACVSWGVGRLDVFVRGSDNGVYHKWGVGAGNIRWAEEWEALGGETQDEPVVVSWGTDRLDIFYRGVDDALYHKAWNGSGWSPDGGVWTCIGRGVTAAPAVVAMAPERIDVFVRGPDGGLRHKYLQGKTWFPVGVDDWEELGGRFGGRPVAVSWGADRLDVFVRAGDARLYHKAWDGLKWQPSDKGWEDLGGWLLDAPAAACWGPERIDIVVRGSDSAAYHKAWAGRWEG